MADIIFEVVIHGSHRVMDSRATMWQTSRSAYATMMLIEYLCFPTLLQIVIASGQILNVNITSHTDLFKSLKGGGNNFGIVTRFDLKTFEQGKLWGGFVLSSWTDYTESTRQLQYLQAYGTASQAGVDDFATVENIYIFNRTKPLIFGNILVDSKAQAYPIILQNFTDTKSPLVNTLRITNLTDLTIEAGGGQAGGGVRGSDPAGGIGNGGRYTWAVATFPNNAVTLAHVLSLIPLAFGFPSHGSVSPGITFQPVTKAYTRHAASNGGNSLGLGPDPGSTVCEFLSPNLALVRFSSKPWVNPVSLMILYLYLLSLDEPRVLRIDTPAGMNFACSSTSPADDAVVLNATETFVRQAQDYTKSQHQHIKFLYSNYALPSQNPIASYGKESQDFLRAVSKKYDPYQVFQKLVPGGFKLYREDEV
jgi:hypothetical protein